MELIDKHRELITELIAKYNLTKVQDVIYQNAWSCVKLIPQEPAQKSINYEEKLGISKFGGLPHLPKDFKWPEIDEAIKKHVTNGSKHYQFIAQFNIEDFKHLVNSDLLPQSGILYFFAYPTEIDLDKEWDKYISQHNESFYPAKIIHIDSTEDLVFHEFPEDQNVTYRQSLELPFLNYYPIIDNVKKSYPLIFKESICVPNPDEDLQTLEVYPDQIQEIYPNISKIMNEKLGDMSYYGWYCKLYEELKTLNLINTQLTLFGCKAHVFRSDKTGEFLLYKRKELLPFLAKEADVDIEGFGYFDFDFGITHDDYSIFWIREKDLNLKENTFTLMSQFFHGGES